MLERCEVLAIYANHFEPDADRSEMLVVGADLRNACLDYLDHIAHLESRQLPEGWEPMSNPPEGVKTAACELWTEDGVIDATFIAPQYWKIPPRDENDFGGDFLDPDTCFAYRRKAK